MKQTTIRLIVTLIGALALSLILFLRPPELSWEPRLSPLPTWTPEPSPTAGWWGDLGLTPVPISGTLRLTPMPSD